MTLWSIGHSNRSLEELLSLLTRHWIGHVADIRRFPNSRRNPQFESGALAEALHGAGIGYTHFEALGGRRAPRQGSPNTALRSDGFRGYADYMATSAFQSALDHLLSLAGSAPVAFLCAEAVPWQCHRSLVSDILVVRGHEVLHIVSAATPRAHTLSPYAHAEGEMVTYPGLLDERSGAG